MWAYRAVSNNTYSTLAFITKYQFLHKKLIKS